MKIQHSPYHWVAVAVVVAVFLLIISEAHGQGTGAGAVFEGRPAMAGAQGGQGAQAGMPQGGLGVQGSEAAERTVKPRGTDSAAATTTPSASSTDTLPKAAAANDVTSARKAAKDVAPPRDQSLAKDQRSAKTTGRRAAKRTITRARHGVSEIDSVAETGTR